MEREKIVKALRTAKLDGGNPIEWVHLICDAADMLENDQREAEALRAEIEKLRGLNKQTTENKILMFDMVKRLTAERDAAVADMKRYIDRNIHGEVGVYACDLCKHSGGNTRHVCRKKCPDGVKDWEWRGPQKEA